MVNRQERRRKDAVVIARREDFEAKTASEEASRAKTASEQWESMNKAGSPPDASPPRVNAAKEGANAPR